MRPFVFRAHEVLAPAFTVSGATQGAGGVTVSWVDPTPVANPVTAYDPVSNPTGFLGNPNNEIGFRVERALVTNNVVGAYAATPAGLRTYNAITQAVNAAANATSYVDTQAGATLATPAAPVLAAQTATSVTLTLPAVPAPATGFNVYRNGAVIASNQPAGAFVDAAVSAGNTYVYAIMAVVGSGAPVSYSYRVVAVTAAGGTVSGNAATVSVQLTSALSATTTVLMVPTAPTGVTVTNPTVNSLTVNWPAAPAAQQVTGYLVSTSGAPAVAAASPDVVGGLAANTTYSFTVAAVNATGTGAASAPASGLTLPNAPTGLNGSVTSTTAVSLSWTASVNGAASYTVQYHANGVATWTNVGPVAGTTSPVTGLTPGTTYVFQVLANNASGSSAPSNQVTLTTTGATGIPGAPGCCTASGATPTSVVINWTAPAQGPVTSYTIQRATNATFTRGLQTAAGVAGLNRAFTGLNRLTTYYFRVDATNAAGTGAWSATFIYTPAAGLPATPAAPVATASAASTSAPTVTLAFAAPAAGTTYTVYQQSRTGGGAAWSAATAVATGVTGTTWTSGALVPNLQYRYHLVAVNAVGSSANGANSNTVTARQLANPPTGLRATNVGGVTAGVGRRSVNLAWSLGASNGVTVTAVRVVRANGATLTGALTTTNLAATATATTVTGLNRNATYTFQVQAVTGGGGGGANVSGSTTVTITTLP